MSWENVKLEDLCISITDGDHQSLPLAEEGIPFIVIADINSNNRIEFGNARYVPFDYYEKLDDKRKPQKGDVLLTVKGSFGIPVYVAEDNPFVFQRDIAILKCNQKINPRFLYYYMKNREFYLYTDSIAIGAAQRAITLKALRNTVIKLPPLDIQQGIVNLLSAYDDLIGNNQKQIKLLEEAAQRLYKEWFVDLHFPGHETTPISDGIPKGWKKDRADAFFNMSIGKTPPRAEKQWFTDGGKGTPWVSISDMGNSGTYVFDTAEALTAEAISKHNVKVVPADTVLVSFKLTVGRVSITTTDMCTNEAIAHFLMSDSTMREYTYLYLKCFEYDSLGNTSAISKAVNSKIIKGMPFVMPDDVTIAQFHKIVKPILDAIKDKQNMNTKLAEARDRLLPKLMNGEIEV